MDKRGCYAKVFMPVYALRVLFNGKLQNILMKMVVKIRVMLNSYDVFLKSGRSRSKGTHSLRLSK